MNGTDPTALSENAFSGSGGSASGGNWVITNSTYTITPTASNYTILAGFKYTTAPNTDEVLMKLDNGDYTVSVKANGNGGVKLVGASTATFSNMDFGLTDSTSVVPTLRLTLDSAGTARLYRDEIINDDEGEQDFISVTGASGSSKSIQFGNTTGNVSWASVYVCHDGSFAPDELMRSDFAQDNHIRMALNIVETLRNSERFYLKTHVENSSIKYAYDISEDTLNKTTPPTIHVLLNRIDSPNFSIFVTTRAINYENAFLLCMNITGEVFDELYTETGLKPTTDNLESFSADLDYKTRNEDVICTHRLTLGYRRRLKMTQR